MNKDTVLKALLVARELEQDRAFFTRDRAKQICTLLQEALYEEEPLPSTQPEEIVYTHALYKVIDAPDAINFLQDNWNKGWAYVDGLPMYFADGSCEPPVRDAFISVLFKRRER